MPNGVPAEMERLSPEMYGGTQKHRIIHQCLWGVSRQLSMMMTHRCHFSKDPPESSEVHCLIAVSCVNQGELAFGFMVLYVTAGYLFFYCDKAESKLEIGDYMWVYYNARQRLNMMLLLLQVQFPESMHLQKFLGILAVNSVDVIDTSMSRVEILEWKYYHWLW